MTSVSSALWSYIIKIIQTCEKGTRAGWRIYRALQVHHAGCENEVGHAMVEMYNR